jgi:Zn-dependent peptidase ImmA (M78 family)
MEERYLKFFNGACNINCPAFDIEKFIDALLKEGIDYDPEASDLPDDVLGATTFNPDRTRLIHINVNLYRQRNSLLSRGRFRFTCAHETFHALVHGQLFQRSGKLVCQDHHIQEDAGEQPKTGDYTEWQANRGAAALLMPRSIFEECVKQIHLKSHELDYIVNDLAARFDVSKHAARIRLQTLGKLAALNEEFQLQYNGIDSYRDPRER